MNYAINYFLYHMVTHFYTLTGTYVHCYGSRIDYKMLTHHTLTFGSLAGSQISDDPDLTQSRLRHLCVCLITTKSYKEKIRYRTKDCQVGTQWNVLYNDTMFVIYTKSYYKKSTLLKPQLKVLKYCSNLHLTYY